MIPTAVSRAAGRRQRVLRRRLWNACQRRQREDIQRAVARYERGGYPPCADLAEAKRLLVFFQLRDARNSSALWSLVL
ncbi:hypothetical protein C0Q70_06190 [Pomacea canaliculata]|uniref:Uncharacterized protein n=1 Tax=Pomacea canaliculata TaxID=400727 RepID=A0A2T7PNB2_POMCA|nr:hypothetical protein C0Q70_06190 [Pomacea canaliculata]